MQTQAFVSHEVPENPRTAAAKFVATPLDVGTEVVRAGCMAELEERHQVLLLAAKLALKRIREAGGIGAAHEFALEVAIKVAEPK